jgi:hypothetical protein
MVVAGIVEYDRRRATYALPAEHAAALTRAAGPDNIAAVAAYFPVLASVEDEVVECFRSGGGVPTRPTAGSSRCRPRTARRVPPQQVRRLRLLP